jgi:hypothetical protein
MTARPTKKKAAQRRPAARMRSKPKALPRTKKAARKQAQGKTAGVKSRVGRRRISDSKRTLSLVRVTPSADSPRGRKPTASASDVIAMLRRDHAAVRKLLAELESAKSVERQSSLLQRLGNELQMHTHVEEEIFYPAFHDRARGKEDRQMYYEALEEHHAVDVILPEVKRADLGSDQFAARVKVLKEIVEHHADEEEKEMFPRARKILRPAELRELGQRVARRKREDTPSGGLLKSFLGLG